MRVSQFAQFLALTLSMLLPLVYLFGWTWPDVAILTAYAWGVVILAALWDYFMWRRNL